MKNQELFIHIELKDAFSGCLHTKKLIFKLKDSKLFKLKYQQAKASIGKFFNEYDKKEGINYTWEILNVKLPHEL